MFCAAVCAASCWDCCWICACIACCVAIIFSSRSCLALRLTFNNWLASLRFLISRMSIASSRFISPLDNAICMFCSSWDFCSSSGDISMNIPKSYIYNSFISLSMDTLYLPILLTNSSLKSAYSKMSATRYDNPSAIVLYTYRLPSSICLVAVFELAAASFCKPTKELGSGLLPSLASFKPVTLRISFK